MECFFRENAIGRSDHHGRMKVKGTLILLSWLDLHHFDYSERSQTQISINKLCLR